MIFFFLAHFLIHWNKTCSQQPRLSSGRPLLVGSLSLFQYLFKVLYLWSHNHKECNKFYYNLNNLFHACSFELWFRTTRIYCTMLYLETDKKCSKRNNIFANLIFDYCKKMKLHWNSLLWVGVANIPILSLPFHSVYNNLHKPGR